MSNGNLSPVAAHALEQSVAELDAWLGGECLIADIENEVSFSESVALVLHELKRLKADGSSRGSTDVLAERRRQITAEGWTPERDDTHAAGELAAAAACYATNASVASRFVANGSVPASRIDAAVGRCEAPPGWPWSSRWWKPKDRRRDLVRAAALIIAEIERLDRAAEREGR